MTSVHCSASTQIQTQDFLTQGCGIHRLCERRQRTAGLGVHSPAKDLLQSPRLDDVDRLRSPLSARHTDCALRQEMGPLLVLGARGNPNSGR